MELPPEIPEDLLEDNLEVLENKKAGKPILALENTIITQGMEYPTNHQTATKLEETIKSNGAVPATICILKGKICRIRCSTLLNISKNKNGFIKYNTRDMPFVLMSKKIVVQLLFQQCS